MGPMVITILGLISIAAAFAANYVARSKMRNHNGWVFSVFLFPPLLIVLLLLGPAKIPYAKPPGSVIGDD